MRITASLLASGLLFAGCATNKPDMKSDDATAKAETTAPADATAQKTDAAPAIASKDAMPPPEASKLISGTAEEFAASCKTDLDGVRQAIAKIKTLDAKTQGEAVLVAYDDSQALLSNAGARSSLAHEVSPDAKLRDAARDCEQQVEQLNVEINQDRGVYDALVAVDLSKFDEPTKYWMEKTLLEFRRAGVDRDEATRAKVKALNEELVKLGQAFQKNIAEDVQKIELDPKELDGLPEDYIKAHAPGANGKVTITSNYPDYFPFMTYAKNGKAREKVWRMYRQRAYPKNEAVLNQLIAKRDELAKLLNYADWAAYVTETKMTRTEKTAADFIQKIADVSEARAKKEFAQLLARKKKDDPKAKTLEPWDQDYYEDRVKAETMGFDSQAIRPYFEYSRVKNGVMGVTSKIFNVEFKPVKDAVVWHKEVEAFDVYDTTEGGEKMLGRIYLDMHPRDDKYKHAAQFDLAQGQLDKRYPEGVLVCNFPRDGELMTADEVETFFHEFGHLLHHTFAGHQRWSGISGITTEWDFVETPSMLLQQWASEPSVLRTFARNYKTNEPLPDDLVKKLRASKEFGKGLWSRRQMFLSAVSLEYYRRKPGFDQEKVLAELQSKYQPFRAEWRPGTHFQTAFGHLEGYSAAYYTYLWSLVIAKDLETEFQKNGFLDPATATKYRKAVLDQGGSKPAAELVKDFLGRDYSFESYRSYLNAE